MVMSAPSARLGLGVSLRLIGSHVDDPHHAYAWNSRFAWMRKVAANRPLAASLALDAAWWPGSMFPPPLRFQVVPSQSPVNAVYKRLERSVVWCSLVVTAVPYGHKIRLDFG